MKRLKIPDCFYRVSIKAIITNDEKKIFLIKEKDGRWELPGGGLEFGERIEESLKRELAEETGLNIVAIEHRPLYIWVHTKNINDSGLKQKSYLFLGYRVEVSGFENINTSDECVEFGFFSKEELKDLNLHINIKNFVFDSEDF